MPDKNQENFRTLRRALEKLEQDAVPKGDTLLQAACFLTFLKLEFFAGDEPVGEDELAVFGGRNVH